MYCTCMCKNGQGALLVAEKWAGSCTLLKMPDETLLSYTVCPGSTWWTFIFTTIGPKCILPIGKMFKIKCRVEILKVWNKKLFSEKLQCLNFYTTPKSSLVKIAPHPNKYNTVSFVSLHLNLTEIFSFKLWNLRPLRIWERSFRKIIWAILSQWSILLNIIFIYSIVHV